MEPSIGCPDVARSHNTPPSLLRMEDSDYFFLFFPKKDIWQIFATASPSFCAKQT